jgi:hypothetical protein
VTRAPRRAALRARPEDELDRCARRTHEMRRAATMEGKRGKRKCTEQVIE